MGVFTALFIPSLGMFCSQFGNISFPAWECFAEWSALSARIVDKTFSTIHAWLIAKECVYLQT
jgi:hypothetical protein